MNTKTFYVGALLVAAVLPLAASLHALHSVPGTQQPADNALPAERWPTHFRDRPLTQLPLSALEQRFAHRFPGAIARFTDGEMMVIVRHVTRATRQLHPADDCFRALGYAIERPVPFVDDAGVTWSCFHATLDGRRVRVCERIFDSEGRQWTDTSAWFWSAQYGGGPWTAITLVSPAGRAPLGVARAP